MAHERRDFMMQRRNKQIVLLNSKELKAKLKKDYDIKVPDNFEEIIHKWNDEENKCISCSDLREIIKIADFWKPCFVDQEEAYNKMVLGMIRSMIRIHCTVLNTNPATNAYVGRFGEINPESKPFRENFVVTTTLSLRGEAGFVSSPGHYEFA